ncbi:MAG: YdbH domain-containing protein [Deltaproteobacteria bacterium]|nr:YdbH domain-containing protein [Deltaproteobacteria bacterium]
MWWRVAMASLIALALLAAGAVLLASRRHALAEDWLVARLHEQGVEEPRLVVAKLDTAGAGLREVRLGSQEELSIERLDVTYSPAGLRERRLDSLRIAGVKLRMALSEAGVSFGSLDAALGAGGTEAPGPQPDTSSAPSAGLPVLPFEEATFEDVRISASTPIGLLEVSAALDYREGRGHLQAELDPFELASSDADPFPIPGLAIDAQLEPAGSAVGFDLRASTAENRLALRAKGSHDLLTASGDASLELETMRFEPGGLQPAHLLPVLAEWIHSASGTLDAKGSVAWQGERVTGAVHVALRDWNLESPVARFEGLNAIVDIDSLWPVSVPAGQLISMARVDFGLELNNGLVRYGLNPDGTIDIERAEWEFAGGRIHTAGRFDPMAEEQELLLEVEDVDLAQLLALVPLEGLSGEGRIGGRLPLVRRGDVLEIRDGSLRGDAAGGWLRYAAAGGIAGLASSQRGFLVTLSAFENLRWESLELGMNGDTHGIVEIRLHVRGRNPEYQSGRPVEFNLNVESRLADLLRGEAASYRIPAEIEKRLVEITAGDE